MRVRTLLILTAVTVPTVAAAFLLPGPHGTAEMQSQRGGGLLLPGLKGHENTLARIDITGADGTVTLSRTPLPGKPSEGWGFRDKGNYPVSAATIGPVIDSLAALHGLAPKTDRVKLFDRLDLGDPGKGGSSHLVALTDAKGAALGSIVLGKIKPAATEAGVAQIYARVPGSAQTWLGTPSVTLPGETLDWLNRTIVDIDEDKVREVKLTQPGNPALDFVRFKTGDKLVVRDVPAGEKLKSDTPGSDIESAFSDLDLDDVKPDSQLGGSAAGTVHLETFTGIQVEFTLRKDNGKTWATVTASGTGDGAKPAQEIAARTKGWAYEIPSDRATTMTTTLPGLLEEPGKK